MEWDQRLFRSVYRFFWKGDTAHEEEERAQITCSFEDVSDRLTVVARLLTGRPIRIHKAESVGGVQGSTFFLPQQIAYLPSRTENMRMYLFRTAFMATQDRIGRRFTGQVIESSATRLFTKSFVDFILHEMYATLPASHDYFASLFPAIEQSTHTFPEGRHGALFGRLIRSSELEGLPDLHSLQHREEKEQPEEAPQTEHQAPPREETESLIVDQETIDDYTLLHQFEKVETADDFNGRWREMDGDDELSEHLEALEELDLRNTVRSDVPTHSILQADFLSGGSIPDVQELESDDFHYTYSEWNYKKRAYREDFCKVFPQKPQKNDVESTQKILNEHKGTLRELRKKLARFRHERERRRRQKQGEYFDLDALVDRTIALHSKQAPDERVYLFNRPHRRDIAVLILMDVSLSTDAFTNNRRILDVEKESVLLFGQLLHENNELFQVDAFSSRTRNFCQYTTLKGFETPWPSASGQIGGVQSVGYTRIGPALRHATHILSQQKARKKWILFLSDGKPNDYDRYEGKYGIHDVRQAIREAHQEHISTYALAIEKQAQHTLPRLFGRANYKILPHPRELPEALLYFYTQLLHTS